MSRIFTLPELAESVVEGEIIAWRVAAGDHVARDQPLVEVMTDKVTVEIPSPFAGRVEELMAQEGEVLPVGAPLARWSEEGDAAGEAADAGDAADEDGATADGRATDGRATDDRATDGDGPDGAAAGDAGADDGSSLTLFTASAAPDEGPLPDVRTPDGDVSTPHGPVRSSAGGDGRADARATGAGREAPSGGARGPWGRPLAVPAARKRARELGVPLERVLGSGPHGRVRVEDVTAAAGGGDGPHGPHGSHGADGAGRGPGRTESAAAWAGAPLREAPEGPEESRAPLRGLRRIVAQQMMRSHLDTVRTLHVDEADVSELVALRTRLKADAAARGVQLTYLPFVLRALVSALAEHPMLNAWWDAEREEIVRARDAHLGVAVDAPDGLVVPVVRHASRRSLLDLAAETSRLAEAARSGRLAPGEVRGGTFSVTNVGAIGGLFSFPIIHAPQAAILGVHAIKKRPVVLDDDRIVPRSMLYLSLAFDHRLVDGADAARFTNRLIAALERPETLLLDA